jgi:hypothetical protein
MGAGNHVMGLRMAGLALGTDEYSWRLDKTNTAGV